MKRIAFTIADNNNLKYYQKFKNSWDKFCPNVELKLWDEEKIKKYKQEHWFYKATPIIANELFAEGYDVVLKMDCDQIVTGNLDHIWEGDFDIAVVQNTNPRDIEFCKPHILSGRHRLSIYFIPELAYVNAGMVVMKNKELVKLWERLCEIHFKPYRFGEQDLLNILVFYGNYNVRFLDMEDKWHGLVLKWYWKEIEKDGEQLVIRKNDKWPKDEDKVVKVIHWAGGGKMGEKMIELEKWFQPEVVSYLNSLIV